MSNTHFIQHFAQQLETLQANGLYKEEYAINTHQAVHISVAEYGDLLNFCANNYLGLANRTELVEGAYNYMKQYGYGLASVRFICGTQDIHKILEARIAQFVGMEDVILYSSCFDANGGLFETILTDADAVISDELNHASIIDGVRLCKAKRYRYKNNDIADLEAQLRMADAAGARFKVIVTDGVFSMDGVIANLPAIADLRDTYNAILVVDDSHATGFMGKYGRGTHEYCGVMNKIDIITSTLGKALGGGSGGFTAGKREVIQWLRQRSRPYLFSNSITPSVIGSSLQVFDIVESEEGMQLREKLWDNAQHYRNKMTDMGFTLTGNDHAIIPVLLGDATISGEFSRRLLARGIYAISFSYPVVPHEKARIRTQMSAAHSIADLDRAMDAFYHIGTELAII